MLTDTAIKSLKPKDKMYKVADRDGMYVRVMPTGAISFRLDYRLNGRRETVYFGKYGRDGISLFRARELLQRRHMMQEWSDMIDAWLEGRKHVPVLTPPSMPLFEAGLSNPLHTHRRPEG